MNLLTHIISRKGGGGGGEEEEGESGERDLRTGDDDLQQKGVGEEKSTKPPPSYPIQPAREANEMSYQ